LPGVLTATVSVRPIHAFVILFIRKKPGVISSGASWPRLWKNFHIPIIRPNPPAAVARGCVRSAQRTKAQTESNHDGQPFRRAVSFTSKGSTAILYKKNFWSSAGPSPSRSFHAIFFFFPFPPILLKLCLRFSALDTDSEAPWLPWLLMRIAPRKAGKLIETVANTARPFGSWARVQRRFGELAAAPFAGQAMGSAIPPDFNAAIFAAGRTARLQVRSMVPIQHPLLSSRHRR